jgi:hypothetical protein
MCDLDIHYDLFIQKSLFFHVLKNTRNWHDIYSLEIFFPKAYLNDHMKVLVLLNFSKR